MRLELHIYPWTFEIDTSYVSKCGFYKCCPPCRGCDYLRWEWGWFRLYNAGRYR